VESITIPCGFHMDIPWNGDGIKVEWNQKNEWDSSQNIFHMEWMESTWNYMESTGIHMEYGGRVKTLCRGP